MIRRFTTLVLAALVGSGCSANTLRSLGLLAGSGSASGDGSPIARATNGASASFTMVTCQPTVPGARVVEETLIQLNQQGVVVVADGPGTITRVTLNMCGAGGGANPSPASTPSTVRR